MKRSTVLIVQICMVLLAVLIVISCVVYAEDEPHSQPPEVNTEGLCCPAKVVTEEAEPAYELYYTPEDAETIAKAVWGEARGCTLEGQAKVVWVILNRVDDSRFPDTIQGVVTQPCQFFGYSPSFPVMPEIMTVVNDVLHRWNAEKNGIAVARELDSTFVYFTGDGAQNHFRAVY